ncbi:MAG: glgC [Thermoleophilia bacterium]|nr:glgC [Thermoleophilia bacterium]
MSSIFVMAAGKGTRLAPWTLAVPKPVLPVANEPALGFLLRLAARHGYRDIVANASWLGDVLTGVIGDGSAYGVQLDWQHEDAPLGTAGGVLHAQEALRDGDEPVVVLSGDGIHDVDLAAVERTHRESGAIATLAVVQVADPSQYGVALVDDAGRITGFQEKPAPGTAHSNLANTGIYVLDPRALDRCAEWGLTDFGSELFPRLLAEGMHLQTHDIGDAYWNDIGDLDEWRASNVAAVSGAIDLGVHHDDSDLTSIDGEGVLVHPTATIAGDASLGFGTIVGAGAHVGSGVHLASALILPGARVPDGVVIASGTFGSLAGLEAWATELAAH